MDDIMHHFLALRAQLQELFDEFDEDVAEGVVRQALHEVMMELNRRESMQRTLDLAEQVIEEITSQNNTY